MVKEQPPPLLEFAGVDVVFHGQAAVRGLSFALTQGQIGCLLGPSGCGKTTALRALAGFEPLAAGEIRLDGTVISRPGYALAPEKRRIGMVFQDYALFPHLTVAGNVGFGLRAHSASARRQRVAELLELTGLSGSAEKYPHELSGGQQQRIALARALAPAPGLLLLDEPFSNLDTELRERLSLELREILKSAGTTAILVTHDQHEAFAIADVIGLMNRGRIEQWDAAYNLYHRPANRFVADFIGQGVFLDGRVLSDNQVQIEFGALAGDIPMPCHQGCAACGKGCSVDVLLRPDDVIHDDASPLQAEVLRKAFRGAEFLYTLRLPSGREVLALVPSHHNHAIGERIGIRLEVDHVVAFQHAGAGA
ncbi:MAG: ABC transporter ATP-binding protein [Burkholderiales bacterium]|nr:ABC transporter ATP-binding protein [Burkholderiales bacterium]